jgi:hypothetical protein
VKTAEHLIIIDDMQTRQTPPPEPSLANGFVRASEIAEQNVLVLYSTFHWPELTEYLHTIEDSLAYITYVHNKNELWRGCRNTLYVGPNETHESDGARLHVIQTAHFNPGLAFVCEVDGLTVYCGRFAADDRDVYSRDLDTLKAAVGDVDIAFLPLSVLQPGQSWPLELLMNKLFPRMVCFTNPGGRECPYPDIANDMRHRGYDVDVFGPQNAGDRFVYRRSEN